MPFSTDNYIAFQEREEKAHKDSLIPVGTYNWEIESSEVTEVSGVPRLRVVHRLDASNNGQVGRIHSELFNWYANENAESDTPYEQRERNLRGLTGRKLQGYMKALSSCPTSTQVVGDAYEECLTELLRSDDTVEVGQLMGALGDLLEGQYITGRISHSKTGWANLSAIPFDPRIGAAESVAG